MAATRNACAGSVTWEKATGRVPFSIARNFREIDSVSATIKGRESLEESSTGNGSPDRGELQTSSTRSCSIRWSKSKSKREDLHPSPDRFGDCPQAWNEVGENFGDDRLFAIALGEL